MKKVGKSAVLLLLSSPLLAFEPEFYIHSQECKILIASLIDKSVKVAQGDASTTGCRRNGSEVTCAVSFKSGGTSEEPIKTYRVLIDSPPMFYFGSENGAEFYSVNFSQHTAVVTARMADATYTGYKVCGAVYLTAFEVESLRGRSK